ncbi:MAG: hypothetical protein JJT89_00690 [Nitriliruptoraceae bacterium]|nr:hypothetical protein [Nitriliruptoraceae bacterium]
MTARGPLATGRFGTVVPLALTVVGAVALGLLAFTVSRAIATDPPPEPWVVPVAEPVGSFDLHPEHPLEEALAATGVVPAEFDLEEALTVVGEEGTVVDDEPLIELPASGPLPPGVGGAAAPPPARPRGGPPPGGGAGPGGGGAPARLRRPARLGSHPRGSRRDRRGRTRGGEARSGTGAGHGRGRPDHR